MLASTGLSTAITLAVLAVIFALINRSAAEPAQWAEDAGGAIELVHGRFVRQIAPWVFGMLPTIGLLVVAGLVWEEGEPQLALMALGGAVLFGLAGWLLFRQAAERVQVDPERVRWIPKSGVERVVRWDAVREVRFSGFWNALVLIDNGGEKVRVSMFLRGFDLFTNLVRDRLEKRRWSHALEKLGRMRKTFGA